VDVFRPPPPPRRKSSSSSTPIGGVRAPGKKGWKAAAVRDRTEDENEAPGRRGMEPRELLCRAPGSPRPRLRMTPQNKNSAPNNQGRADPEPRRRDRPGVAPELPAGITAQLVLQAQKASFPGVPSRPTARAALAETGPRQNPPDPGWLLGCKSRLKSKVRAKSKPEKTGTTHSASRTPQLRNSLPSLVVCPRVYGQLGRRGRPFRSKLARQTLAASELSGLQMASRRPDLT